MINDTDVLMLRHLADAFKVGKRLEPSECRAYVLVLSRSADQLEHLARVRDAIRDWLQVDEP